MDVCRPAEFPLDGEIPAIIRQFTKLNALGGEAFRLLSLHRYKYGADHPLYQDFLLWSPEIEMQMDLKTDTMVCHVPNILREKENE